MRIGGRGRLVWLLIWVLVGALLWYALRDIDWDLFAAEIGRLTWQQIGILFLVNSGIVLLFGSRWWVILRARGYRVGFLQAAAYRLAAFSISYFTPGPHLGGEPLQVYLVSRREKIPAGAAAGSVAVDKLLELAANFAFLAFGIITLLSVELLDRRTGSFSLAAAVAMLALPLVYLGVLATDARPLQRVVSQLPAPRWRWWSRLAEFAGAAEAEASRMIAYHRFTFFVAVILSGVIWAALIFEYMLAIRFLGIPLNFSQVISVMTAARIAILLPMPGGLGTLEAALVLATRALGENAAFAAGLSLLIRSRDVAFGLLGLWLGRRLAVGYRPESE